MGNVKKAAVKCNARLVSQVGGIGKGSMKLTLIFRCRNRMSRVPQSVLFRDRAVEIKNDHTHGNEK